MPSVALGIGVAVNVAVGPRLDQGKSARSCWKQTNGGWSNRIKGWLRFSNEEKRATTAH